MTLAELNVAVQAAVNAGHGAVEVRVSAMNGEDDFLADAFAAGIEEASRGKLVFQIEAATNEDV